MDFFTVIEQSKRERERETCAMTHVNGKSFKVTNFFLQVSLACTLFSLSFPSAMLEKMKERKERKKKEKNPIVLYRCIFMHTMFLIFLVA